MLLVGDDAAAWRDLLPMLVCSHLFASICVSATILARVFIFFLYVVASQHIACINPAEASRHG